VPPPPPFSSLVQLSVLSHPMPSMQCSGFWAAQIQRLVRTRTFLSLSRQRASLKLLSFLSPWMQSRWRWGSGGRLYSSKDTTSSACTGLAPCTRPCQTRWCGGPLPLGPRVANARVLGARIWGRCGRRCLNLRQKAVRGTRPSHPWGTGTPPSPSSSSLMLDLVSSVKQR
jgi:hypothetical protein